MFTWRLETVRQAHELTQRANETRKQMRKRKKKNWKRMNKINKNLKCAQKKKKRETY